MGYIYILTVLRDGKSSKKYVGQTRRDYRVRFRDHMRDASNGTDSAPALHRALRKYGMDHIEHEIVEVHDDLLDFFESLFIEVLGTMHPNGYNLTSGGQYGTSFALDVITKNSEMHRKYHDHELKLHMAVYEKGDVRGFRVIKPNCQQIIICDSGRSMDEKYQEALRIYDLSAEEIAEFNRVRKENRNKANKRDAGVEFPLQDYLTYIPEVEGFRVRSPNKPMKAFVSAQKPKLEKYQAALEYLNS
jgi:group I intron endonuclease